MRITGPTRPNAPTSTSAARGPGSGAAFTPFTAEEPAAAAGRSPMQPLASLDALIALQAFDPQRPDRRKAIRRGHDLLDTLDAMRLALLDGEPSAESLDRLASLVAERGPRDDEESGLESLLDDIDLRARVELAKRGRFLE